MQEYCSKCRETRLLRNIKPTKMADGRLVTEGICSKCGTKVYSSGRIRTLNENIFIYSKY